MCNRNIGTEQTHIDYIPPSLIRLNCANRENKNLLTYRTHLINYSVAIHDEISIELN